jgi:hypothetical protein
MLDDNVFCLHYASIGFLPIFQGDWDKQAADKLNSLPLNLIRMDLTVLNLAFNIAFRVFILTDLGGVLPTDALELF